MSKRTYFWPVGTLPGLTQLTGITVVGSTGERSFGPPKMDNGIVDLPSIGEPPIAARLDYLVGDKETVLLAAQSAFVEAEQ